MRAIFIYILLCVALSLNAQVNDDIKLIEAIKENNFTKVKELIANGANINATDVNLATPLMWASYIADVAMVKYLVENGADYKMKGIIYWDPEKTGAYGSPLITAAGEGKYDIVQYLIEICKIPIEDKEIGVVGDYGWNALQTASYNGQYEIVEYLIKKGADVNSLYEKDGGTPLLYAARNANYDIVKTLITAGADITLKDSVGFTCLHYAARDGNEEIVNILLKKKIDINQKQILGWTPLMLATFNNQLKIVNLLFENNASVYIKNNDGKTAIDIAKEQKNEVESFFLDIELTIAVQFNEAFKLFKNNNYEKALKILEKHLPAIKQIYGENDTIQYAPSLKAIADCYKYCGLYSTALPFMVNSYKIVKTYGEKSNAYPFYLGNLAALYYHMGNYSEAEPLYLEELNIIKKGNTFNKNLIYATVSNNLAILYKAMGNYTKAESLFIEASDIFMEIQSENSSDYLTSLDNLANILIKTENYSKAESLLLKGLHILTTSVTEDGKFLKEDKNFIYIYVGLFKTLANLYSTMGNYEKAEPLYTTRMNISKKIYGKDADFLDEFAGFNVAIGNYSKAEPLYIEVLNIYKESIGEKHNKYATATIGLAHLYCCLNNYEKAEPLFLNAINILTNNTKSNFKFLSENEKEKYWNSINSNIEPFNSFVLHRYSGNPSIVCNAYNYQLTFKGILLSSNIKIRSEILKSKDILTLNKYNNWVELKEQIGWLSQLNDAELVKRGININSLEEAANSIEKEMSKLSNVFAENKKLQETTWLDVKNSLMENEAAIEFLRFKENKDTVVYCALLVNPNSKYPEMIKLFEEKELSNLLSIYGANNISYINSIYGTNQDANDKLYKLIWTPMEKYLDGVKTIYYSPDGLLHKISFSAIAKGKDLYLCDNYSLHRLSTTGKVAMPESFSMDKDIAAGVFGGIEYSTDTTTQKIWQYLPGTKGETDNIEQIFKTEKIKTNYLSGKKAGEKEFKETASTCNLLHIATHGFFYPDPEEKQKEEEVKKEVRETLLAFRGGTNGFGLWQFVKNKNPLMRSGLVFAGANNVWNQEFAGEGEDGVLTAQEVSQLDLSETELVVMSACETGLGDIRGSEGVYGLQRAFKMAGVKFLIMSLWQVPDKETEEFMTQFYEKLLRTKNIRKSFNETQSEMRKKYDPYYWGAFVLIE